MPERWRIFLLSLDEWWSASTHQSVWLGATTSSALEFSALSLTYMSDTVEENYGSRIVVEFVPCTYQADQALFACWVFVGILVVWLRRDNKMSSSCSRSLSFYITFTGAISANHMVWEWSAAVLQQMRIWPLFIPEDVRLNPSEVGPLHRGDDQKSSACSLEEEYGYVCLMCGVV